MKRLRIGRKRAREVAKSPLELALAPALTEGRWTVPQHFNFARDVMEPLAADPKRRALTFLGRDGVIEPKTFLELLDNADRWATVLRERGVQPGDRVVLLLGTNAEWLELLLACVKVGAVATPCSPNLPVEALDVRIASSGPALVIAGKASERELVRLSFTPEIHYLAENGRRRSTDAPEDVPTEDTAARDLALLLWTAGSATSPKPVAHTHGAMFAARVAAEHWLDAGPGDAVWCTTDAGSAQSVWSVFGTWARRAEVLLQDGQLEPLDRLDLIHRLGATILCQTPADYRALAELRELPRFRTSRLRRLVSVGDHLDPDVVTVFEEAWGLTIHDAYGQAETGVIVANGAEAGFKHGSIGIPLPGQQVGIIDAQGNELPPGAEGDLALRGRPPTLYAGYWESPDETKDAFRGDWYVTGDVARVDEDGFYWFLGRSEDLIAGRGGTFAPYEVEHSLRGHPAVGASAVVGIRDLERGGHFVRAFVVLRPGVESSEQLEAEIRHFVAQTLPEEEVPREIEFVDALPTSASGAVKRQALRARPVAGRPLWELPPTSEPEAEPEAEPLAASATSAPEVDLQPFPDELPPPMFDEPAVEPAPVVHEVVEEIAHEPEPTLVPEPESVVEAAQVVEPAAYPEPVAEPEPLEIPQYVVDLTDAETPAAYVETTPDAEASALVEPEPIDPTVAPAPEPEALTLPEPEPAAEPEPEPAAEPEPVHEVLPEYVVAPSSFPEPISLAPAPEPESVPEEDSQPLPEYIVDPATVPEPIVLVPEPEPEPEPEVPALPEYVVDPETAPVEPVALVPPRETPLDEEEVDLGPLPEYVVDPDRPLEPAAPHPESPPTPPPPPSPFADLGLRPATFPVVDDSGERREDDEDEPRRRRPTRTTPQAPDKGRTRSAGEPGDEADEVGWMQGLSNRLSAYSLSQEDARAPEASEDDPQPDDPQPDDPQPDDDTA